MVDDGVAGTIRDRMDALEVVLVGAGERARAWLDPLQRSPRLRLVATVARDDDGLVAGGPVYPRLREAMDAHPEAVFAIPLPPRSALEGALSLVEAGRSGVVEAPLHPALCNVALGPDADRIRVAHGWVTLPGRAIVDKLMRRVGAGRLFVEIAGLPEAECGEAAEVLVHGLALIRSLLPLASVARARAIADGISVDLVSASAAGDWTVEVKLRSRGQRVAVRVESHAETLLWSFENGRETVMLGSEPVCASRVVASGEARALAQLVDEPRGDTLVEAARVLLLQAEVEARLAARLPPSARRLRQSASIGDRRPADLLARLGLHADVSEGVAQGDSGARRDWAAGAVGAEAGSRGSSGRLDPVLPAEPFELWAFRAGVKPVAFLTVAADAVERTLGYFGDVYCERRERLVSVTAQDRWDDRRDRGEARIELYLSHDADLARRAAYLQAEVDPTAAMREIGELVGYPSCCVEAFASQADRSNNSLNRYYSWSRTVASAGRWPWQLNNLHTMIAPFYPCTYGCSEALAWARAVLAEMAKVYPEAVEQLRDVLLRPVLYFDHDHQLILEPTAAGEVSGEAVDYRAVAVSGSASRAFAGFAETLRAGNRLFLDGTTLRIERDGSVVARFVRTDPALGFLAPFGV